MARARENGWSEISDYDLEDLDGPEDAAEAEAERPSRLGFLSPSDCANLPAREYIVKNLIAPGQVGCLFGEPGSGKSVLAPYVGYMIAQGACPFGLRARQGAVHYIACEDDLGMADRVKALREDHGEAPGFWLVRGVSDLFAPGPGKPGNSRDLAELSQAVKRDRPKLIIVDTLAMAMPGLEENDAAGMNWIVQIGRKLARHDAAVIFIHHGTKADGGTPRGHSTFNGALDFSIRVERASGGVVRGKVCKNRNGPPDLDIAFRIGTREVGTDIDGERIEAPICEPCDQREALGDGLTPAERATFASIRAAMGDQPGIDLEIWKAAARDDHTITRADKPDSRRRAVAQALGGLQKKGCVEVVDEQIRLPAILSDDELDDLEGDA